MPPYNLFGLKCEIQSWLNYPIHGFFLMSRGLYLQSLLTTSKSNLVPFWNRIFHSSVANINILFNAIMLTLSSEKSTCQFRQYLYKNNLLAPNLSQGKGRETWNMAVVRVTSLRAPGRNGDRSSHCRWKARRWIFGKCSAPGSIFNWILERRLGLALDIQHLQESLIDKTCHEPVSAIL